MHLLKSLCWKHAYMMEEIHENANESVYFMPKTAFGLLAFEAIVALEVAFLHDLAIEPLRPMSAGYIIERHFRLRKTETVNQQIAKGLPRFHHTH